MRNVAVLPPLVIILAAAAPSAQAGHFAQVEASAYVCSDMTSCNPILSPWPSYTSAGGSTYYSPWAPPNLTAQVSNGGVFESFNLTSEASADLSSGSLRAAATITNDEATQGRSALVSSTARFGDSFSFATGQGSPFNWGTSDFVTLNIHIDGLLTNSTTDIWPATYGVQFAVRQYGAIQSTQGTPLTALGQLNWSQWNTSSGPGGYEAWSMGGLPITATVTGSLAQGDLNLQLSFKPNGDFDWDLTLYTQAMLTDLAGTKSADFSHTLNASFVAPTGSIATSSSGVFPITSAVPEPAQWLVLALGLPVLAWARRRKNTRAAG